MNDSASEIALNLYAGMASSVADQQLHDKIGMKLLETSPGRVVGTIPVDGNLQPYGLLHGGASAALAETLGSIVAAFNAGENSAATGLELSCTHHRAVSSGTVTGVATPLHVGRATITVEIVLTDDQDRRTCTARLTCIVRGRSSGA